MKLPAVTARYWALEFEGAYGTAWDEELYQAWNRLLNDLSNEGVFYLHVKL